MVVRRGALAGGGRGKDYPWAGLQGLQTALRMTIQKEDDDGHRKGIPAKDISLMQVHCRTALAHVPGGATKHGAIFSLSGLPLATLVLFA